MKLSDCEAQEFDASKIFVVKVPGVVEYDEYQDLKKHLQDALGYNNVLVMTKDVEIEALDREDLMRLRDSIQCILDGTSEEDI